ncbi:SNF2 family N-terminal domain-containing protein [Nemania sp. FL0031]|nr:SNF2 family N-terminal domain-containing protein [Nemania sp. FL0031]
MDDCSGGQHGAKRRRIGEYPNGRNDDLRSLNFKVPELATPILESGLDNMHGSICSTDNRYSQRCAITESTFIDTAITNNTFNSTEYTDGISTETALTDSMFIGTTSTSSISTDTAFTNNTSIDTIFTDSILKDAVFTDQMCIDAEVPTKRPTYVCYGALCDAKVKVNKLFMTNISAAGIWDQYQEFNIFQQNGVYHMGGNQHQESIGVLDIASSRILKSLYNLSEITYTIVLETSALKKLARTKTQSGKLDASINILGPESLFDRVGDAITDAKGYLQHPFFLPMGMEYFNPHWIYPRDVRTDLRHFIGPVSANPKDTSLALGLVDIFHGLGCPGNWDTTLIKPVELSRARESLVTHLKSHQEEGVNHILARENSEHVVSTAQVLQGVIGHTAFKDRLTPLYGGIDADVMGLGKTLTMLSAIAFTIQVATDFAGLGMQVGELHKSRATLVIVPSHQLIEVWRSEIEKHFKEDTLYVGVFHGSSRAKTEQELTSNDIVLTTYHTLVADQKSSGLLQRIEWFRVVLDEAHWIRNSTSQQFKAACSLMAARRWCLSGTPISNSLDDLRSLLAFLQFRPFSEPGFFRKHIVDPLGTDSPSQFINLRMLLHAICFRRTTDLLLLPPHQVEEVAITLSDRETEMYEMILTQSKKEYEEIANMKSSKKRYTVLFAATMKLRRLCNHGTYKPPPTTNPGPLKPSAQAKSRTAKKANDRSQSLCEYCYGDNADLGYTSETLTVCPECSRTLGNELGMVSAQSQQCTSADATSIAPPLQQRFSPSVFTPQHLPSGFMDCSSKLNTVIDNIQRTPIASKNLVFTSWRMTLDILQQLLTERGIASLRIDGQTSFTDRQSILKQFCEDSEQIVLLLSIATGAVGLTLTVADRVHIVEPQWNPLVEEQAIGRALRIGQTRPVTIFKYITKGTVEENIVSLQKRKSHLARISLDGNSADNAEEKLEDFMFVLQQNGPKPRNNAADV